MENFHMDVIKSALVTFFAGILAYLDPITNMMWVIIGCFTGDLLFGILSSLVIKGEKFKFKKFALACVYLWIYLAIVASIYTIGEFMDDGSETLFVVKTITYIFIYFYMKNISGNINQLFPENRVFGFLDYMLGFEFAKKIPALDRYNKLKEVNDNSNEITKS